MSDDSDADCTFRKSVGTQCISVSLMDFWSLQQTIPVSDCAIAKKKPLFLTLAYYFKNCGDFSVLFEPEKASVISDAI